jgi:hypothetical protein
VVENLEGVPVRSEEFRGPDFRPVRVFVVGTPRSGTTLLQSMLASHPQVLSFPETHYFKKIRGRLWRIRKLGVVSPRAAAHCLDRLVEDVEPRVRRPDTLRWSIDFSVYGRSFRDVVDTACVSAGKQAWVDKSPVHLHCIDDIAQAMPDARFVHLLRDGRDVTASFYERCLEDPERWVPQVVRGRWRSQTFIREDNRLLAAVIARWNADLEITLAWRADDRHLIVRYDELVNDPGVVLRRLCDQIGLAFSDSMLEYKDSATRVLGERARFDHMLGIYGPLRDASRLKWESVLNDEERRFASAHLCEGGSLDRVMASATT